MIVAVISEYLGNLSSVKPLCLPSWNILKKMWYSFNQYDSRTVDRSNSVSISYLTTYINYTWSAVACEWRAFQKSGCSLVRSNSVIAAMKCISFFSYYSNCYEYLPCILLLVSCTRAAVNACCLLHFFQAWNIWLNVYATNGWIIFHILFFLRRALWYNYVP